MNFKIRQVLILWFAVIPFWGYAQVSPEKTSIPSQRNDLPNEIQFYLVNKHVSVAWNHPVSVRNSYRIYTDFSGSMRSDNRMNTRQYDDQDSEVRYESEYNDQNASMIISTQWLHNLKRKTSYNLYCGLGPQFSYFYGSNTGKRSNRTSNETTHTSRYINSDIRYGLGFLSIIGLDKTLTKKIFFFVEYHLSVDYYLMNNTYQDMSKESRKSKTSDYLNINRTHRTMIELSGTKIGLSLQF